MSVGCTAGPIAIERAMYGRIMHCGIISSCQSTVTFAAAYQVLGSSPLLPFTFLCLALPFA